MRSMPLRSMATLATSRESLAWLPFAEMSIFSSMLAPLIRSVSKPAWPWTVSLASPGFQMNVSSPAASEATSFPVPPMTTSLPALPTIVSSPAPALMVRLICPGVESGGVYRVVPGTPVDEQCVVAGLRASDGHPRRQSIDDDGRAAAGDCDVVVAGGAVDRDGKGFRAVAAVDLCRVDAVGAFEPVGVVARIPNHAIVAGFAEHLVVAIAAGQCVVAGAAEQQVVPAFAEEGVVAGAAEQLIRARAAGQHVVAGAAEQQGGRQRTVGF